MNPTQINTLLGRLIALIENAAEGIEPGSPEVEWMLRYLITHHDNPAIKGMATDYLTTFHGDDKGA